MERITGLKREYVLGKCAFDLFPFIKETGEDECLYAALAGESTTSANRPYLVPDSGREGLFKAYYSPLRNQQDEVVGGIAVIHDITERKRAEEAAQKAHQRLTFHVENSPLAVIEWDSEFRVSRWSQSAERLFGWQASEVIDKHVSDWHFVFDEDVDAVSQVTHRQRIGTELLGVQHNRNYTKDGSVLYCEWYNSVLRDESGKLVSVLSLVLDVTARKLVEEERAALLARERDLRQQAEEADRLKDEFLATLSHELRTPLTSILGWATLIRNGDVDKEAHLDRALEIIERNARSQARLIDDLLDVSRIITGNLQLDVHPLNIAPVVETAIDALRPAAAAKGIRLDTNLDCQSCLVSGDPNRLRQVIWNLLMNAIKFTPGGGSVSLRLQTLSEPPALAGGSSAGKVPPADAEVGPPADAGGSDKASACYVRLTVSDTGDGITPEFLPYVFHRFRQEEGSISRKAGGLGLGLAVVRHLVELHGGAVSAESLGPGRGSTFTVDLPLAPDRRDDQRNADIDPLADEQSEEANRIERTAVSVAENVQVMLDRRSSQRTNGGNLDGMRSSGHAPSGPDLRRRADKTDDGNVPDNQAANREAGRAVASLVQLAGVRVLLVEDDDDSRNLLSLILGRYGAKVIPAASAAEALHSFQQTTPDIIVSDIGMVEGDGYALLRQLRALPVQGSLLPPGADSSLITHDSPLPDSSSHSPLITRHSSLPLFIPAIALTGYATLKDRERALSAGYQLHLAKPVEPEDLVAAIVNLVYPSD